MGFIVCHSPKYDASGLGSKSLSIKVAPVLPPGLYSRWWHPVSMSLKNAGKLSPPGPGIRVLFGNSFRVDTFTGQVSPRPSPSGIHSNHFSSKRFLFLLEVVGGSPFPIISIENPHQVLKSNLPAAFLLATNSPRKGFSPIGNSRSGADLCACGSVQSL